MHRRAKTGSKVVSNFQNDGSQFHSENGVSWLMPDVAVRAKRAVSSIIPGLEGERRA
jgi:hypothetical protein